MFAQKKKSFISGKTFAVIVIILFAAGYFINTYDFGGGKENNLSAQKTSGEEDQEAANANVDIATGKVSSDTQLLMRIYDNVTNTTKTQELLMPPEVLGKTFDEAKTQLLSKYEGCTLKEINESYILLYRVIDKSSQEASANINLEADPEQQEQQKSAEFYLIKEDKGIVKVYHSDADGNLNLLQNTEIQINFLSSTDQELFKYGVIKHNMDEVNEVLQDFEG